MVDSVANQLALWTERAPQCSCRREPVALFCDKSECANNKKQPIYCT